MASRKSFKPPGCCLYIIPYILCMYMYIYSIYIYIIPMIAGCCRPHMSWVPETWPWTLQVEPPTRPTFGIRRSSSQGVLQWYRISSRESANWMRVKEPRPGEKGLWVLFDTFGYVWKSGVPKISSFITVVPHINGHLEVYPIFGCARTYHYYECNHPSHGLPPWPQPGTAGHPFSHQGTGGQGYVVDTKVDVTWLCLKLQNLQETMVLHPIKGISNKSSLKPILSPWF